ncbi:MAG: hypothetical protein JRI64_10185 [Deltaproteobacteria bacterium]|nr:hypothetical protein [Deltaproteobacteria bacterium]
MIYTTNLRGDILDMNQAGVEMLGYSDKKIERNSWIALTVKGS